VRSFVFITALALAAGWVGIRHLPTRAEADVVKPAPSREVQSISFDGRSLPMATLREALVTKLGDVVDQEKLARDRESLLSALADRGYLAAQVDAPHVVQTDAGAFVTFAVNPGPEFRVRSVTVSGATPLEAGVVTLAAGDIVDGHRLERAREALADRLAARGKRRDVLVHLSTDDAHAVVDIELVASR
jgi:outer membrane protein assembly factor BamA